MTSSTPKKWNESKTVGWGIVNAIGGTLLLAITTNPDVVAWLEQFDRTGPLFMVINGLVVLALRYVTDRPIELR